MRRLVLVLAALVMLSACALMQSGRDSRARNDCERENRGIERAMC